MRLASAGNGDARVLRSVKMAAAKFLVPRVFDIKAWHGAPVPLRRSNRMENPLTKLIPEARIGATLASARVNARATVRPDRKQNILEASQRLFARFGYHAVTIRQIAHEAEVPLALVGYYFGQKQELYDAVFSHLSGTIDERHASLRAAVARQSGDALANIVDALITPVTQSRDTPEGQWYALFVARGLTQQSIEDDKSIREYFDPLAVEFIEAMHGALTEDFPDLTQAQVAWCFQFALGALLHYLSDQRVVRLSKGVNVAADPAVAPQLHAFIVNGIRGGAQSFVARADVAHDAGHAKRTARIKNVLSAD